MSSLENVKTPSNNLVKETFDVEHMKELRT